MALDPEALSLVNLAQAIFDGVVAGYAQNGATLPSRRYVTLGTPANDCEQMVVAWQQIYLGTPGDERRYRRTVTRPSRRCSRCRSHALCLS